MIEIDGNELYQWDTGRRVVVTGIEVEHVHFANQGDSKAVIMGAVDIHAQIPDFLLQSGKQLCVYAVKDGITVESKTFYVKKRERPENYVYEDDRRNYIYELVANAESAIESMWWAYQDTNIATENANLAAENANNSADSANRAAKNAAEASYKANHTAKSLMVIGAVKGNSITVDDSIEQFLVGMRIFGKTTQDGTPTPDAPVELESVGDRGGVIVNVVGDNYAQSMTVETPNGLPGIPVTSGGNYIDANGQQWICDEIDFARGVYVQRTTKVVFDANSSGITMTNPAETTQFPATNRRFNFKDPSITNIMKQPSDNYTGPQAILSNYGTAASRANSTGVWTNDVFDYFEGRLSIDGSIANSLDALKAYLAVEPIVFIVPLSEPIETPLSAEDLAAYASLHTYRGNTTFFNDASAHMEIEYAMDAKTYIGRLINGITAVPRVVNVSLPASKWAGSGNLYSQKVLIDGITENSQVNLTPSVEQLSIFYEKDVTFMTENDGGIVTVYVIGQKPTNDYTIKASIVEVIA